VSGKGIDGKLPPQKIAPPVQSSEQNPGDNALKRSLGQRAGARPAALAERACEASGARPRNDLVQRRPRPLDQSGGQLLVGAAS